MLKFLGTALGVLLIIYFLLLGYMYLFQHNLVYAPHKYLHADPEQVGLKFEEVYLDTADGVTIHGWFVPSAEERGVVLFCHGNAGNISHRLPTLNYLHSLNMSTFIFDYRGFGKSQGKPSEEGTYNDALAAWDHLTRDRGIPARHIFIMGRSLGGAVAADLASEAEPAGIILESTFTSIPELGREMFPFLPVRLLARYSYATRDKISSFSAPAMIIHSRDDELIPFLHGRTLYELAPQPRYFLEISGNHNSGYQQSQDIYLKGLREFFTTYAAR